MVAAFAFIGGFRPHQQLPVLDQYSSVVGFLLLSVLTITLAGLASAAGAIQVSRRARLTGAYFALFLLLLGVVVAGFLLLALLGRSS